MVTYTPIASKAEATTGVSFLYGETAAGAVVKQPSSPFVSLVTAAPSSFGTHSSVVTAFDGDLSKVPFAVEYRITGAATLSQPASGYVYTPEATPHYTYLYNTSGWNNGTATNAGRTSATAYRTKVFQAGQGDCVAFNAEGFVTGTRAGSTNFLANPAASLFNGGLTAGADGVYLNPYETIMQDGGYDVACFGAVYNFERTVATGAKSAVWGGARYQNTGAATCDAIISGVGKWVSGIDFSMSTMDLGANAAAISLKAGQKIYFNNAAGASGNLVANWRTTSFNGDYIDYDSGTARLRVIVGGTAAATFHASSPANFGLGINIPTGKNYQFNGVQVVSDRDTGYAAMTGAGNKGTVYDTTTVTLAQLAGRVMSLQASLSTHGLIGA